MNARVLEKNRGFFIWFVLEWYPAALFQDQKEERGPGHMMQLPVTGQGIFYDRLVTIPRSR